MGFYFTPDTVLRDRRQVARCLSVRLSHPIFRMVPVLMTFNDLFKVMIIQRQIT